MSDYPSFNSSGKTGEIFNDPSDLLANKKKIVIDLFHVPTGRNVVFKGYVTSFSDKYTSDWNSEEVYGRMDPIQTFKKTSRAVSLEWDVVSASLEEAKENLERCTELFSMLYPSYTGAGETISASTITAGPLFKLRFTNLLQDAKNAPSPGTYATAKEAGLIGTISGFTYEPDFEAGMFAEGIGTLYPQTIKLSCDYTVNHNHGLGFDDEKQKRLPGFPYNSPSATTPTSTGPAPSADDVATSPEANAAENEVTQ